MKPYDALRRGLAVVGIAVIGCMSLAGCDDKTIDRAAEDAKGAVDSAARASKQASESSERLLEDANREAKELLEKANRATDGGVDKMEELGKQAVERTRETITP